MPLPTPDKTWQIDGNNTEVSVSDATFYRTLLLNMKNAMLGFGTAPMTTRYSGNSVTAGTAGDGVDRWTTITNIVGATTGGVRSWYVFGHPTGMQLCWHCFDDQTGTPTQVRRMEWVISPVAGFTGGTNTARPTATDQTVLFTALSGGWFGDVTGTVPNRVWHMWHSTDGLVTRFVGYAAGVPFMTWAMERIKNPGAAHTTPNAWRVALGTDATTNRATRAFLSGVSGNLSTRQGALNFNLLATYPGRDTAVANSVLGESYMQVNDELEGGVGWYELPLVTNTIGARGGKRGQIFDLWAGQTPPPVTGDHFPLTPSPTREFVQIGHHVYKWDGTVHQTT